MFLRPSKAMKPGDIKRMSSFSSFFFDSCDNFVDFGDQGDVSCDDAVGSLGSGLIK